MLFQKFMLFLLILLPISSHGMGKRAKVDLMAAAGDSITAGTLADTSSNPVHQRTSELSAHDFHSNFLYQNKDSFSWASGTWINSHFVRLRDYLKNRDPGVELEVLNVAIPGNETQDLGSQADRILSAMNSGAYSQLRYLTLMIGANDTCDAVKPEAAAVHLRRFFEKIAEIRQQEKIRILVSGLPPIPILGKEEVLRHKTAGFFTCEYIRNRVFHFCKGMTAWEDEKEFERKMGEILAFNETIRSVIREIETAHPHLDIAFSETFTRYDIPLNFLALDCFHPNRSGQEEISRFLWEDQPWFGH
jgi:lysophospholipase L1-like esterase